ncbi:ATP-binding cassette domain-containing protein [Streptomyces boncukensis]|uniref:ATP-binding cassette domain-containing protein n=1 Tax=Streptomyces boncukensis TaxID=2711219 RepID=UPI001F49BD0A|nr:ABC transporter ATP-binding protein [Streptomyces boncukensis]
MTERLVRRGLPRAGVRFLADRRGAVAALAGWSLLESAQTFALGYALARALDDGFLAGNTAAGLGWLAVAAVGVLVGALGTARVYRAVAALAEPLRDLLVGRVVRHGLAEAVLRDGASGPPPGTGGAGLVSRVTHQVELARDSFSGVVMVARSFVFTALGALAGLLALAPPLLLVVLPPLLLGLALFFGTLRPLARRQAEFLAADERLAAELGSVAAGLRDVVAAGAEERTRTALAARVEAERRAADALARWSVSRALAVGLGGRAPLVLLLVLAPWLLDQGVTPGALAAAVTYLTQALLPALEGLVQGFGSAGARLAVVITRLTSGSPHPAPGPRPAAAADPRPATPREGQPVPGNAVEAHGVRFGYGEADRDVLAGLDLVVPRGGRLAVVGPSGTGKSTLALLIAGLLTPRAGEIRADPRVLIPQEAYVFTGSVRDNLRYLRTDPVPDAEVLASAAAVGAGRLVARLGGPDADLDPAALSAGERQLLALARAHLSRAPLAVLDEATCHLDPVAEERAERAFAQRPGGTLVVVAHRISSARRAERVLVLDGARAVVGTHDEVAARSPLYRDLAGIWAVGDRSQPAGPPGDTDGINPVARPGLAGDGRHVVAHRPVGEAQPVRDLRDRSALGGD